MVKFRSFKTSIYEKCFDSDYFQNLKPIIIKATLPLLEYEGYVTLGSAWLHILPKNLQHKTQYQGEIYSKKTKSQETKLGMYNYLSIGLQIF